MTDVLLIGAAPLPIETEQVTGGGLRTWHFLQALIGAGHHVTLIANRTHGLYPPDLPPIRTTSYPTWTYHNVADAIWHDPRALRLLIEQTKKSCVVAVTTSAASISSDKMAYHPLWADLYGSLMAEAQLKALVYADDAHLDYFWRQEYRAVRRADRFSTVSDRQQWALIGELGAVGRLNQRTAGYAFAHTIPIASEPAPFVQSGFHLRGKIVPEDAFVILHSGGFNTWTDVDTLVDALDRIMAQYAHVYLVATGGTIAGHDDLTYGRFQRRVEESVHRDRYVMRGWVGNAELPAYYLESDVAVCTDRYAYEARLGSRTRVLDWLRAGLPCVLSSLTELATVIRSHDAGLVYRAEDAHDLASCLAWCVEHRSELKLMGAKGRDLLKNHFGFAKTAEPLLEWVADPQHAPDFGHPVTLIQPAQTLIMQIRAAVRERRLSFSLALRLWPVVARMMPYPVQQRLAALGLRLLRMPK